MSGGADSAALAILAAAAGIPATLWHVDHGLRPGSAAEASVVADLAAGLGHSFVAVTVGVESGPNLEARARTARYSALPEGVMTGHTMDDVAETVLLNTLRGAALDGLAPMGRPGINRPLLGLRRWETREVCARFGYQPVEDPSNDDRRFRRNRVRSELLPLLADIADRDVVPVLARQAELLADDAALLETQAAHLDPTDVHVLRSAPAPVARRALRAWLRDGEEGHPPSRAEIDRVMQVVVGGSVACELSGGRRVSRSAGRLSLGGQAPVAAARPGVGPALAATGAGQL